MGNTVGSMIVTVPPVVTWLGAAFEEWYVYDDARGTRPAEPTIFCAEISVGAFVPGKMKSSPAGMLSHTERGKPPKFLDRSSFCKLKLAPRCQDWEERKRTGLWAKTSDARKVLSSEKLPSSKTSKNSTPPFSPCNECGTPLKLQLASCIAGTTGSRHTGGRTRHHLCSSHPQMFVLPH